MNYRIEIQFLDHSSPAPTRHPLIPTTRTGLPPKLDAHLTKQAPHLILPSNFWQPLKHTHTKPATTPLPPQPQPYPQPQIWSESAVPIVPAIPTAQLYTGTTYPTTTEPTQKAILDYRFGPISFDWIDHPHPPPTMTRSTSASSSSALSPINTTSPMTTAQTSGTTDLYWGSVHLYREAGAASTEESTTKEKQQALQADDGKVVALVSVPGNFDATSLLAFLSTALESVAQIRMVRLVELLPFLGAGFFVG